MLPLPEVLVPQSSPHQLDIQIPPSIQPLITPHTIFLLNKSDLIAHILPPTLSTASSFSVSPHPNAPSHQVVDEGYSTTPLKLIPSDTSGSSYHSQAWSTSLVTNQGTHEFVQGLAEALKSRYVIYFPPFFSGGFLLLLFYFKSAFSFSFNINNQTINKTHAPLITRARHRVHLESACLFLKAFLDTRLYISPLSSYNQLNYTFFSIFWHCLSGRRTPIRRPSRRTCNRRDRDRRCAGCFVQGFLYWEMRVC